MQEDPDQETSSSRDRGGGIYWWVQSSGNAPWPVALFARGDAIIEAKSGLPIERNQVSAEIISTASAHASWSE